MKRILYRMATSISALFLVMILIVWITSMFVLISFGRFSSPYIPVPYGPGAKYQFVNVTAIACHRGIIDFIWGCRYYDPARLTELKPGWHSKMLSYDDPEPVWKQFTSFQWKSSSWFGEETSALTLPLWLLALLTAVLPSIFLIQKLRRPPARLFPICATNLHTSATAPTECNTSNSQKSK